MKNVKVLINIFISLVFLTNIIVSLNTVSAEDTKDIVNADITVNIDDGANFNITAEISISKFTLKASDITYTGEQIKNIVSGTETMGAVKYALRSEILNQIKETFKNAETTPKEELPSYENGLFYDNFQVELTSNFFGINNTIDSNEMINGILDMGGWVNYTFNFQANNGWNNTYTLIVGGKLSKKEVVGGKRLDENKFSWTINNWNGEYPTKEGFIKLKKTKPTVDANKEDILIEFNLDTRQTQDKLKADIKARIIDIREYDFLPGFISNLTHVSSDGIRLFVKNKMISWNETIYEKTLKPIQDNIKETIETSVFNQTLNLEFKWDSDTSTKNESLFDIKKMDTNPPVTSSLVDNDIQIRLFDISSRAAYGLLNTGGIANTSEEDINFGKDLGNIGYPYTITIIFPEKIFLDEKQQNRFTWNDTIKFEGIMKSSKNPDYKKEEKHTTIEIDFKGSDLNILGFFTSNPKLDFNLDVDQKQRINVTRKPEKFIIPEEIKIDYINSDSIRLCVQEGVFTEEQINNFLENKKSLFNQKVNEIISNLEVKGKTNRETFDESINQDINISDMNKEPPIETDVYANTIYPVKYNFSFIPPSFNIPSQKFTFNGIKNQSVTYKILFPNGIDIDITDTQNKAKIKQTKDNRYYIEISFSENEYNLTSIVSCKLIPSPLYIIGLFTPCIISFFITIVLIIVILLIRRNRRYKKATPAYREPEENQGYENEEYYMPPPPGSK